MDKSEYELERDRNMAENAQHLAALGIEPLVKPKKRVTAPKPRKKKPAAPLKPARASGRLAGKPLADEASLFAALDGALADADAEKDEAYEQLRFEQAYRASKKPRLSAAQSAELHALEAAAPGAAPAATSAVGYVGTPLTAVELAAAEQAADNLANGAVHGGLKGAERMEFLKKGQYWGAARALLRASAVRRPAWLDDLEAFLPRTSKTTMSQENRDQTMFALERACAGLGLSWKALPEGEGAPPDEVDAMEYENLPARAPRSAPRRGRGPTQDASHHLTQKRESRLIRVNFLLLKYRGTILNR